MAPFYSFLLGPKQPIQNSISTSGGVYQRLNNEIRQPFAEQSHIKPRKHISAVDSMGAILHIQDVGLPVHLLYLSDIIIHYPHSNYIPARTP